MSIETWHPTDMTFTYPDMAQEREYYYALPYDSLSATSSDDLAFTINSFVYDFYIRDISTKIRTNLTAKKQNGEYAGAFVAYGYVKDSNDKSKLVVDQFAANVVKDIFRWKIEGLSPQNIAVRLNELGIPSPAEYKRLSGSKYKTSFQTSSKAIWSHVSVRRILKNEIYLGIMIQGKRTTPNYKTKTVVTKAESEWLRAEGTHEAIISVRDFELVQELLKDDTHCRAGDVTVPVYAGRIYCGDCGAAAVRKTVSYAGRRYVYYVCNANKHDKMVCSRHSIREDVLNQVIYQTVRHQIDLLLKSKFRPEFLNRLDEIVYYKSLTKTEIGSIVDLMLADLRKRLEDKQLKLVVTDAAKNAIIDGGYDPIYGARPLKRFIQSKVETLVAKKIISDDIAPDSTITVDIRDGELVATV